MHFRWLPKQYVHRKIDRFVGKLIILKNNNSLVNGFAYDRVRTTFPFTQGVKLVQVIHVNGVESIEEALSVSDLVDALLLDSGNQDLDVKELGGTGRTHDWQLSKSINDAGGLPLILEGGVNAANAWLG